MFYIGFYTFSETHSLLPRFVRQVGFFPLDAAAVSPLDADARGASQGARRAVPASSGASSGKNRVSTFGFEFGF